MTRRFRAFGLVASFLLAHGGIAVAPAWAMEQRCAELGQNCVCSEPLAADQVIPPKTFVDPQDSSSKECPGEAGDGRSFYAAGGGAATPAYGFPQGGDVDYVWRVLGNSVATLGGRQAAGPGARRMCVRLYHRFSSSFDTPHTGTCERVKIAQISGPNFLAQFTLLEKRFHMIWVVKNSAGAVVRDVPLSQTNPSMDIEDCKGDWCRAELCVSGDLNSPNASDFTAEARVEAIDSKTSTYFSDPGGPVSGGDARVNRSWIGNLFLQGDCHGYRDVSHGMQAEWTTDQGQWIGPAYELESGALTPADPAPGAPASADPAPTAPAGDSSLPPQGTTDPSGSNSLTLAVSFTDSGASAGTALASVSGGTGPFQFLFDCGSTGHWDGVIDTAASSASFACQSGNVGVVSVLVWDRTTGETIEGEWRAGAAGDAGQLGPPGQPVLVQ